MKGVGRAPDLLPQWNRLKLYVRILIGLVLGLLIGLIWGKGAGSLEPISNVILKLLGAVATPMIFLAVLKSLITAQTKGREAARLGWYLITNTLVAITIGLLVANTLKPGNRARPESQQATTKPADSNIDPVEKLMENIPGNLLKPLVDGNPVASIIVALGLGFALRKLGGDAKDLAARCTTIGFDVIVVLLHWIIEIIPLAILCKVASIVGVKGFKPFEALGAFIIAVLLALLLQAIFYMLRLRLGSWVRPTRLITGTRDALIMAFSTATSTGTLPVTYATLTQNVGLREESVNLGAMVGSNFNHDGTALYEAMCALFISQMIGMKMTILHQIIIVLTAIVASIGAAGIPEAGLVTMTLVFNAVGLPIGFIPLLLPVDWFLDRCRTTINVLGDMTVCCLLDGQTPSEKSGEPILDLIK
jgi:DAACS family dicarboxylate/amino acid:cation (Na+ or H+) symporter